MPSNKDVARRIAEEVYGGGKTELLEELCAANYVNHDPIGGDIDRNGEKELVRQYRAAFPDLRIEVRSCIAEGDLVCTQWRGTGTHTGELLGAPSTSRKVTLEGVDLARFEDGKVVEVWGHFDTLGFLQQLGVLPSATRAPRPGAEVRPS